MKYYVYFDAYGHVRQIISEKELDAKYHGNPQEFAKAANRPPADAGAHHSTGHVGTLSFASEKELRAYLEAMGDEIDGFYGCRAESRPYNF